MVKQAKNYLKKNGFITNDPCFLELKDFLEKENSIGYIFIFTRFLIEGVNLNDLKQLFYRVKKVKHLLNKLPDSINNYYTYDQFLKAIKRLEIEKIYKNIEKELPSYLKKDLKNNKRIYNNILYTLQKVKIKYYEFEQIKDEFLKFSSRYKDIHDFYQNFEKFVHKLVNKNYIFDKIRENNVNIVYNKNNQLAVVIENFKSSSVLGNESWCITTQLNSFNDYCNLEKGRIQYFLWNFNLNYKHSYYIVGITLDIKGEILMMQDKYNKPLKNGFADIPEWDKVKWETFLPINKHEIMRRINNPQRYSNQLMFLLSHLDDIEYIEIMMRQYKIKMHTFDMLHYCVCADNLKLFKYFFSMINDEEKDESFYINIIITAIKKNGYNIIKYINNNYYNKVDNGFIDYTLAFKRASILDYFLSLKPDNIKISFPRAYNTIIEANNIDHYCNYYGNIYPVLYVLFKHNYEIDNYSFRLLVNKPEDNQHFLSFIINKRCFFFEKTDFIFVLEECVYDKKYIVFKELFKFLKNCSFKIDERMFINTVIELFNSKNYSMINYLYKNISFKNLDENDSIVYNSFIRKKDRDFFYYLKNKEK